MCIERRTRFCGKGQEFWRSRQIPFQDYFLNATFLRAATLVDLYVADFIRQGFLKPALVRKNKDSNVCRYKFY